MFYKLTCLQVGHITEYANCVSRYCPGTNAIFVCEGGLGRIRLSQLLLKPSAEVLLQSHAIMQRLKLNLNLKKKLKFKLKCNGFEVELEWFAVVLPTMSTGKLLFE